MRRIMQLLGTEKKFGQLSREDIIRELNAKSLIIAPRRDKENENHNIKAASVDISPSCLIMSVRTGHFMRIYSCISQCEKGHRNPEWHCNTCRKNGQAPVFCPEQRYVYIEPRDTALVLSNEYLKLPANICGNVFSRVSTVSSGLGHISTTIDPLWKGALLIAISNPSSEPVKLMLQDEAAESVPLATVALQYLNTPVTSNTVHNTHLPARVDILEKYLYDVAETKKRCNLVKNALYRFLHIKDYNLTVRLIDRLKKMKDIEPDEWKAKLEELEKEVCAQKIRGNTWRTKWQSFWRWVKKILVATSLCALVYLIYQMSGAGATNEAAFISALIIAAIQCFLTIILNF